MSDPNETAREGGPAAVRAEFDRGHFVAPPAGNVVALGAPIKGFIFQGDEPIAPAPMLVEEMLPFSGLAFIGGQSGAGKTFIAVDLAVGLASGTAFFGRKVTERVGVVIVAAEGRGMIAARIEAARRERCPEVERLPIARSAEVPELSTQADVKKFGAALGVVSQQFTKVHGVRLGAVIIDTVVSTFDLDDEDNNSEAARPVRKMRELGKASGALIMPVHHYGKSITTGLRGGSSWRAGADVVVSVLADRDDVTGEVKNRRMAIAKARDGIEGPIAPFTLRWVQLGPIPVEGPPFGTCVVEPQLGQAGIGERAAARGTKMNRGMLTFREAFAEVIGQAAGVLIPVANDGPNVRAARVSDVRAQFDRLYATGESEQKKRTEAARKAFKRALDGSVNHFATRTYNADEWIWSL